MRETNFGLHQVGCSRCVDQRQRTTCIAHLKVAVDIHVAQWCVEVFRGLFANWNYIVAESRATWCHDAYTAGGNSSWKQRSRFKPNTHRRRRRNSTVELSCVGVGGVYWIRNYSSRRQPTKIWKLNMLRIYPAELSCVGGVYAPVGCRDPVYISAAIGYGCRIVNWANLFRLVETVAN